jgi:uncharacterized YigZ family protein
MRQSYDTVLADAGDEFTEKRSRFIGVICPVESEDLAQARIAQVRAAHRDASHNCFAYVLKDRSVMRYSDDGEPQGTAGVPILEVIKREQILNVLIVVTRYFGGTLLGAGGLIRAYTHTAKLAIDAATRVTMCLCGQFMLECPYPLYERMALLLADYGALVLDTAFGRDVTFSARMRADRIGSFSKALSELTNGQIAPEIIGEEFAPV